MRKIFCSWPLFLLGCLITFEGCRHEKPNVIYMPDMVYSPAFKAQKEGSMLMPVKGTIPRGFESYPYKDNPEAASRLKNPIRPTKDVLARGKHIFNVYCNVCHGSGGLGDGSVVSKGFPRPPNLLSDKVRGWTDGRIYHTITVGQNNMPSYASQVSPGDRWAAIHYVRALQRANRPTPEDLKIAEQESK